MSGREFFDRDVAVKIGSPVKRTIKGLRIDFTVKRKAKGEDANAEITIWNLSSDFETVFKEPQVVILEAGYGGNLTQIFKGIAPKFQQGRDKLSRIFKILAVTGSAPAMGSNVVMAGNKNALSTPKREIAKIVAAANSKKIPFRIDATNLPEVTIREIHGNKSIRIALRELVDQINRKGGVDDIYNFYDEDGTIKFVKRGTIRTEHGETTLSPSSGLIGSPKATQDGGIQATSLLNPKLKIGADVTITGIGPTPAKKRERYPFSIIELQHKGSNWVGSFHTIMTLRPVPKKKAKNE